MFFFLSKLNTRAAECIRALDLLIRMNSGERVVNSLDDQFDATMFKVTFLGRIRVAININTCMYGVSWRAV